ncbi:hypothetical protein SAMN05421748_10796 [Paractinoplanes atraurantiacus]|uniref:Uncharacterized protein n=1 Tax=Paractinoplanes atraurantiacus TaxID=1036182 RepID=A0A285I9I1_9ACTN|nr:hypothetical protein SAMN05421748_10796 [Actinoplanes atraurantiacus]
MQQTPLDEIRRTPIDRIDHKQAASVVRRILRRSVF